MDTTKIEWADSTFNPWEGCTKVGPGCDHCYAENRNARFAGGQPINWGPGAPRRRTSPPNWRKPLQWEREADAFQAEHGRRRRVFCASLADVFDNEVDPAWRHDLFNLILSTPSLDWLLLTKRIGNAARMIEETLPQLMKDLPSDHPLAWPWPNVWLGATVVNQAEADRDIPKLLATPAAVRFLSMEPLLGDVNLTDIDDGTAHREIPLEYWTGMDSDDSQPSMGLDALTGERWQRFGDWTERGPRLDWVIVGGESGPEARPIHPAWARSLRDQCEAASVPYLFKQHGEFSTHEVSADSTIDPGMDMMNLAPAKLRRWGFAGWSMPSPAEAAGDYFTAGAVIAQRVGKKAAGRLLDGIEHNGFPRGAA